MLLDDNYWQASVKLPKGWWLTMMEKSLFDQLIEWSRTIDKDDWRYSTPSEMIYFKYAEDASTFRLRFGV